MTAYQIGEFMFLLLRMRLRSGTEAQKVSAFKEHNLSILEQVNMAGKSF